MSITMATVADRLQGTCNDLEDGLIIVGLTIDTVTIAQLQELDEMTMLCDTCGWWCEADEFNDDQVCDDCRDNNVVV